MQIILFCMTIMSKHNSSFWLMNYKFINLKNCLQTVKWKIAQ